MKDQDHIEEPSNDLSSEKEQHECLWHLPESDFELSFEGLESGSSPSRSYDEFYESCTLPIKSQIEAILFAAPKCMKSEEICELLQIGEDRRSEVDSYIQELVWEYDQRGGGFRLESVRGHGFQFRSVLAAAPLMKRMFASRPRPLSRAALETLAIIAYRQPATRAEIEFVRGVDAGGTIKLLLERNMIACVGRKEEAGRPMLFGTTSEFLQTFGIGHVKDLPPLSAFQASLETIEGAQALDSHEQDDLDDLENLAGSDFVGDDSQDAPEISIGLSAEDMHGEEESMVSDLDGDAERPEDTSLIAEPQPDQSDQAASQRIQGATAFDRQSDEEYKAADQQQEWQDIDPEDQTQQVPGTEGPGLETEHRSDDPKLKDCD